MTTQYDDLIRSAAKRYGVPYAGFRAQLVKESGLNPRALSPAGARGIAQFMPGTAQGLGIDPYDPQQAIPAAAKHMATLYKNLGTWEKALAGYNAGAGAVQKYGGVPPYAETQGYVKALGPLFAQAQADAASPANDPHAGHDHGPPVKPNVSTPTPENNRALQTLEAIREMRRGNRTGGIRSMLEAAKDIGGAVADAGDALSSALDPTAAAAGAVGTAATDAAAALSGAAEADYTLPGGPKDYEWAQALAEKFGLKVTSTFRSPAENAAVGGSPTSAHMTRGLAADLSGSPDAMMRAARWALQNQHLFEESFYDPLGRYLDNRVVRRGGIGGHSDHWHVQRRV